MSELKNCAVGLPGLSMSARGICGVAAWSAEKSAAGVRETRLRCTARITIGAADAKADWFRNCFRLDRRSL